MHELGLCDAMLKLARDTMRDEQLEGINKITVEVGSLSGVVPRFLADCWEAVIDGTELSETELVIEEVQGMARCLDCGAELPVDLDSPRCPECGGDKLMPVSGRDLTVKEIEAY